MSTTVCSQAQMVTYVLGSMLKVQELHTSLSAHRRIHPPVIHVVTLLVFAALSLSQPSTTRSTAWTARSSPRVTYTSSTTSTPRQSPREHPEAHPAPFQALTRSARIATSPLCDNESRVAEPCEQPTPHHLD